jgi:biopolymer transport protein ExbD
MAAAQSSGDDEMITGINVTPLVDVVLVLLIIFLITAPTIYQSAIKIQLPRAASGDEPQKSPLAFTITRQGDLYWDRDRIEWESLDRKLQTLGAGAREETAMIGADEATPHGTVVRLMDALRAAGLHRIALNVESKTPPPKKAGVRVAASAAPTALRLAALR